MKFPLTLLVLLCFGLVAGRAADESVLAAVRAADDHRITATVAADRDGMMRAFSDELRYAHSSGKIDSKQSLINAVAGHGTRYRSIDYVDRTFRAIAGDVVLMTGRGTFKVTTAGQDRDLDLGFLAVWRNENGQWRMIAWQSCPMPKT